MKKSIAQSFLLVGLLTGCQSMRDSHHASDEHAKETKSAWAGISRQNKFEPQEEANERTTAKSKRWPFGTRKSDELTQDSKSSVSKSADKTIASKASAEDVKKVGYQRDNKTTEPNKLSNAAEVIESKTVEAKNIAKNDLSPPPSAVEVHKSDVVEVVEGESGERPVRLLRPYGVDADQEGLQDNFTWRLGASYFDNDQDAAAGFGATSEFTSQIGNSSFFWHAGGAVELRDGMPVTGSIGFSKLAKIENGKVTKPLIFAMSYDGLYEQDFRIADQSAYFDGARFLAGWAVRPWLDFGAWGMVNLNSDTVSQTVGNTTTTFRGQFHDRVAGYVAMDFGNRGSRLMGSIGEELDTNSTFYEVDYSRPLFNHTSFFVSAGYTDRDGGIVDGFAGLEVNLGKLYARLSGRDRRLSRSEIAENCGVACADACDPCACDVAYRGGWAYDNYRSALRVLTPSRTQRYLGVQQRVNNVIINDVPPPVIIPPPGPKDNPPAEEDCVPRYNFQKNESRLSKFLDTLGTD